MHDFYLLNFTKLTSSTFKKTHFIIVLITILTVKKNILKRLSFESSYFLKALLNTLIFVYHLKNTHLFIKFVAIVINNT